MSGQRESFHVKTENTIVTRAWHISPIHKWLGTRPGCRSLVHLLWLVHFIFLKKPNDLTLPGFPKTGDIKNSLNLKTAWQANINLKEIPWIDIQRAWYCHNHSVKVWRHTTSQIIHLFSHLERQKDKGDWQQDCPLSHLKRCTCLAPGNT